MKFCFEFLFPPLRPSFRVYRSNSRTECYVTLVFFVSDQNLNYVDKRNNYRFLIPLVITRFHFFSFRIIFRVKKSSVKPNLLLNSSFSLHALDFLSRGGDVNDVAICNHNDMENDGYVRFVAIRFHLSHAGISAAVAKTDEP